MNNGGSATAETEKAKNEKKQVEAGIDAFGRAIARIAVGQICETAGFQSCQESALEALADIAVRYLRDLGKSAHFYANLACRTECNVFDVIQSLEDMNHPQGFVGASNFVSRRLSASATVKDIILYTNRSEEIPFARPVPHFPVAKKRELMPSFSQMGKPRLVLIYRTGCPHFPIRILMCIHLCGMRGRRILGWIKLSRLGKDVRQKGHC